MDGLRVFPHHFYCGYISFLFCWIFIFEIRIALSYLPKKNAGHHERYLSYLPDMIDNNGTYEFSSDEAELHYNLFKTYNPALRPVRHSTDTVHVALTFSLMQIHTLDEQDQIFRTTGWLIVEWTDERLQWSSEKYPNISEFVVESQRLWTPELALINGADFQFPDFSMFRAVISQNGNVRWEPAGIFSTTCKLDITHYPYDKQTCDIVFGTWTFTSFQVNLTNTTSAVILDDYNTSGQWDIASTKVERREFIYDCCPNIRFSKVASTIRLRRKHRFYNLYIVTPCVMLSCLSLVTFLSPPDQGEKLSLGISVLLSFSVFMLTLADNMPKTSENIPWFGFYTTAILFMNTLSVMLTVLVLRLHHTRDEKPVPKWLKTIVFGFLAHMMCMHSTIKKGSTRWRKSDPNPSALEALLRNRGRRNAITDPTLSSNNHVPVPVNTDGFYRAQTNNANIYDINLQNNLSHSYPSVKEACNSCHGGSQSRNGSRSEDEDTFVYRSRRQNTSSLDEWRKLAYVVDHFLFWCTLMTLVILSVVIFALLWT